jgi:NAD(P)-dependent dehydrogenase (short-subunit alcohol dehydrogenase family)
MPKIVMITGASAGLGRELVRALVARGDVAIGLARRAEAIEELQAELGSERFLGAVADVSEFAQVAVAAEAARARFGRIDGLIANAAIYPRGHVHEQDPAEALRVFAINVVGVANAVRAVLPEMMATAHGRIVTVGSFADKSPLPASWAYSASKGALRSLTKAVANEVRGDYPDILVNEWVPGSLNTEMGIPEGIAPATAAQWGLKWIDLPPGGPSGEIFSGDKQVEPPASLKRKVLRKLKLA